MKQVIAIFDIGKTNKKLLLFDNNFNIVFQQEEKFPVIQDEDGFECDDFNLITSWINKSLVEITSKNKYQLTGVNFSTYGASLMFLDKKGKPLTPVYNYLKEITNEISEELFETNEGKKEFCRKTASPALGLLLNSGVQILWLKKEKTGIFQKVDSILHFPQYLSYCLTRKIISEPTSIGCHTFMWDFDRMEYHQWLTDKDILLPEPVTNDVVFPVEIGGNTTKVGIGIHDSSAALVPYLKASNEKFILVSTGTWCISMNPFNSEPLSAQQLDQDCLCYLTPDKKQVKSSRLFMGHFHEVWVEKLASHFNVPQNTFKTVKNDDDLLNFLSEKYPHPIYFPKGKESFEEGLKTVDLKTFNSYEEAYSKLMVDLTALCSEAVGLVIPENDETKVLYISGGFARNPIYIQLMESAFKTKEVLISEIDNSSALGAAMVIAETFENPNVPTI